MPPDLERLLLGIAIEAVLRDTLGIGPEEDIPAMTPADEERMVREVAERCALLGLR